MRSSLGERSPFDVRRYTIAGVKENRAASAVAVREFPPHTRKERCGPAGEKDGVQNRDFSPPSLDLNTSRLQSNSPSHNHRSASSREVNGPESWRKRTFGHTKRKSRSMTFSWASVSPTPFPRRSLDEFRISEGASDNGIDSGKHGKEEIWRISSPIPTAYETENCFPAGEAQRWSLRNSMEKENVSNGFDSPASSKISEEHSGGMKKSDSGLTSAQHDRFPGSANGGRAEE